MAAHAAEEEPRGVRGVKLCLGIMNMGTGRRGGPGGAARSRQHIKDSCSVQMPDILFAQEIKSPNQDKWKLDFTDTSYQFLNENSQAGMVYKQDVFEVERIDADARELLNPTFADNDRLCVSILRHIDTGCRLLCISWHGRYVPTNDQKLNNFFDLLKVIQRMKGRYSKCYDALVVGGNFVLKVEEVRKYLEERKETPGLRWDLRYPTSEGMDYFLFEGLDKLSLTMVEDDYDPNINVIGQAGYLDHNAVYANIEFTPSAQTIPESGAAVQIEHGVEDTNEEDGISIDSQTIDSI